MNMKVKNHLYSDLPQIGVTLKSGNTTYHFNGVYDGHKALTAKLLKLMEENLEKDSDKQ